MYFLAPVVLSSHERICRSPETRTALPFLRYFSANSACGPKAIMLNQLVLCLSPNPFSTASEKLVTLAPLGVARDSGSLPRLPPTWAYEKLLAIGCLLRRLGFRWFVL